MYALKNARLYGPANEAAPVEGAPAVLHGIKCSCGYVAFPAQAYGCERCGRFGINLQPMKLKGSGQLMASSKVHLHAAPYPVVPFTVVEVSLDDGPIVRGLLASNQPSVLPTGSRVVATLQAEQIETDRSILDLRFSLV